MLHHHYRQGNNNQIMLFIHVNGNKGHQDLSLERLPYPLSFKFTDSQNIIIQLMYLKNFQRIVLL